MLSNMNFDFTTTELVLIPIGVFIFLVLNEYFCRITGIIYSPSAGLDYMVKYARRFFKLTGRILAKISSFYVTLRLHDLALSFWDISVGILKLITSPFYTIYGYIKASFSYQHPALVYAGTGTLIAGLLFYFREHLYLIYTNELGRRIAFALLLGSAVIALIYNIWNASDESNSGQRKTFVEGEDCDVSPRRYRKKRCFGN